jgi:hypothetical protein
MLAIAAVLATTALARGSKQADPRKAAAALLRSLRPSDCHYGCGSFGATKVVQRSGRFWLGIGSAHGNRRERFRIYRWNGSRWESVADVRWKGWGATQWPSAVSLTGSPDPDFAVEGCGAADTNCLSVISRAGGRWHAVPFEYGYAHALVVNGIPQGHGVMTEVDACSCAGGPSTWTYERFAKGAFRPAQPLGRQTPCSATDLEAAAGEGEIPLVQFDRTACEDGWAIGLGTGSGYTGRVVGLFMRDSHRKWRLLDLDNGTSLPTAPAIYDLPLPLLERLAHRIGPDLKPMAAGAELIARLQRRYDFYWPQQNGLVAARGALWLVAFVHGVTVYRWTDGHWSVAGRLRHVPKAFSVIASSGSWLVSVPSGASGAVAFARAGSGGIEAQPPLSKSILTNAGGRWHVAVR